MEMYLFLAFILLYVLMAVFVRKDVMHKIWTSAFIVAFIITAVAIAFLRVNNQDVMMNANELNWYYLPLFHIFFDGNTDGDKDEDGD